MKHLGQDRAFVGDEGQILLLGCSQDSEQFGGEAEVVSRESAVEGFEALAYRVGEE